MKVHGRSWSARSLTYGTTEMGVSKRHGRSPTIVFRMPIPRRQSFCSCGPLSIIRRYGTNCSLVEAKAVWTVFGSRIWSRMRSALRRSSRHCLHIRWWSHAKRWTVTRSTLSFTIGVRRRLAAAKVRWPCSLCLLWGLLFPMIRSQNFGLYNSAYFPMPTNVSGIWTMATFLM